jgi:predicted transposase/invertase (TIGR01784 family)
MSLDEEFRANYDSHIRAQNDRRSREANAKIEGIAIGEERGIAIGKLKKARETACTMLTKGLSVEIISECTGLSQEDIARLQER